MGDYVYRIAGRGLSSTRMTLAEARAQGQAKANESGKTVHVERRLPGSGMEIVTTLRPLVFTG